MLASALWYGVVWGWSVVPMHAVRDGRCSCKRADCRDAGKHPRLTGWQTNASTDPEQIEKWWTAWPDANIGVVTGKASGLLVIDMDTAEGEAKLRELEAEHGALPPTRASRTGPGRHLCFRYSGEHIPTAPG